MDFINKYALFLFDFDGVLVNSEKFHFKAYKQMCEQRGYSFPLDWEQYKLAALFPNGGVKRALCETYPEFEPIWEQLYSIKRTLYCRFVKEEPIELMPGVENFLDKLNELKKPYCVVTNSTKAEVELIRAKHPVLERIPKWYTREDYVKPKPDPQCYLKAIEDFDPQGLVAGFEDSPKGLKALLGTSAHAHLVGTSLPQTVRESLVTEFSNTFTHLSSFEEIYS